MDVYTRVACDLFNHRHVDKPQPPPDDKRAESQQSIADGHHHYKIWDWICNTRGHLCPRHAGLEFRTRTISKNERNAHSYGRTVCYPCSRVWVKPSRITFGSALLLSPSSAAFRNRYVERIRSGSLDLPGRCD